MVKKYFDKEKWKRMPGFGGIYEISNYGRIWVNPCIRITTTGQRRHFGGKFLQASPSPSRVNAYPMVVLCHPTTRARRPVPVHILVAEMFLGPKPTPQHEVNHKDLNKRNFHHSNLEWLTHPANCFHAWEEGARDGQCNFIVFNGQKRSVTQWGRLLGIKPGLIFGRLSTGMPIHQVLETDKVKVEQARAIRLSITKRRDAPKYKNGLPAIVWAKKLGISRAAFLWRIVHYPDNDAIIYRKGTFPKGCTTADIMVRQESIIAGRTKL